MRIIWSSWSFTFRSTRLNLSSRPALLLSLSSTSMIWIGYFSSSLRNPSRISKLAWLLSNFSSPSQSWSVGVTWLISVLTDCQADSRTTESATARGIQTLSGAWLSYLANHYRGVPSHISTACRPDWATGVVRHTWPRHRAAHNAPVVRSHCRIMPSRLPLSAVRPSGRYITEINLVAVGMLTIWPTDTSGQYCRVHCCCHSAGNIVPAPRADASPCGTPLQSVKLHCSNVAFANWVCWKLHSRKWMRSACQRFNWASARFTCCQMTGAQVVSRLPSLPADSMLA